MDWKYILNVVPDELTENEKDDLFNAVAWYNCDDDDDGEDISREKCLALFKITQEVLKFKGEQVESLVSELDDLAARHGEEEAKRQHEFEAELKSLRSQKGSVINEDLEGELDKFRFKNKDQKKKIEKQSQDIERLKRNVAILEQEKAQLCSELQTGHRDSDSQSDISETVREYQSELQDTVRQKNQQISKLLTDIEYIEKENIVLRENLSRVRDELSDATEQMNDATAEIQGLKTSFGEKCDEVSELENQICGLRNQIEEMAVEKSEKDAQFDEYSREVDGKLDKWKELLETKETELVDLRDKVQLLENECRTPPGGYDGDVAHVSALHRLLATREAQIEELQIRLKQATEEMNASATLMEKIALEKSELNRSGSGRDAVAEELRQQLKTAHERCQDLQETTALAEETAEVKAKELTNLIVQMEKYESGEFGLADAVSQIRDLKTQIRVRDKQISAQIKQSNKKQIEMDMLDQENLALRDKLGIDPEEAVSTSAVIIQRKKQQTQNRNLKNQVQLFENERLEFKLEIQNLKRALSQLAEQIVRLGDKPNLDVDTLRLGSASGMEQLLKAAGGETGNKEKLKFEEDHKFVVEENEALRKGLHEILDSVRRKNESGFSEIKADTLEKLLLALDAKHIAGWYHPAMRLQAELHSVEGGNAELREQLRSAKLEIVELKTKLQQVERLLADNTYSTKVEHPVRPTQYAMPENISASGEEIITKLNNDLQLVLNQNQMAEDNNMKLTNKLEEYDTLVRDTENQFALLQKQHSTEKENWEQNCLELEKEKRHLEDTLAGMEATLREYDFHTQDEDAIKRIKHSGEMSGEIVVLNRKCLFLENNVSTLTALNEKLKKDLLSGKLATVKKLNSLSEENIELARNVLMLDKALKDSVPKADFIASSKRLEDLTLKHREMLRSVEEGLGDENTVGGADVELAKEENQLLRKECEDLKGELKTAKEKVVSLKVKMNVTSNAEGDFKLGLGEEVEKLCKKLANSEIGEVTERQRADHTSGLYELVKEQLLKSEERFRDSELYSKQLTHRNLLLQQNVQDLQDKLARGVSEDHLNVLEEKVLHLQLELADLEKTKAELTTRCGALEEEQRHWNCQRRTEEIEVLGLKHQILDLQGMSDDKAVIARLSSEVVIARLLEAEWKKNNDHLGRENEELLEANSRMKKLLRDVKSLHNSEMLRCKEQYRILQDNLQQMKIQYVGCVPLFSNEKFVQSLQQVASDRRETYKSLKEAQKHEHETKVRTELIEEQIKMINELKRVFDDKGGGKTCEKIMEWYRDKNQVQLNELKHRRTLEFKECQLQQALQRLNKQDLQISQLEEELLSIRFNKDYSSLISDMTQPKALVQSIQQSSVGTSAYSTTTDTAEKGVQVQVSLVSSVSATSSSVETQTDASLVTAVSTRQQEEDDRPSQDTAVHTTDFSSRVNLGSKENKVVVGSNEFESMSTAAKDNLISELQRSLQESQNSFDALKNQIVDKQSQLMFYERRISELQQQLQQQRFALQSNSDNKNEIDNGHQQMDLLKAEVENLKCIVAKKDESILEYQSLLKQDRDEHSLAAARLQDELRRMQNILVNQQQTNQELKHTQNHTNQVEKAAIEQYIRQVHSLERHTDDLQTSVASLSSQLHSSREEAVRWRALANERLEILEKLRENVETQHREELSSYKSECVHWRERTAELEEDLKNTQQGDDEIKKKLQEKDSRILELTSSIKQIKNEARKSMNDSENKFVPQVTALEVAKLHVQNEYDALKRRFEQMMNKERNAREEIRTLKGQLMKRPLSSARSDSSHGDRVTKEQNLNKKILSLQAELSDAKQKLEREMALNEMHREKVDADFNNWDKQKRLQESLDKLKEKLKLKTEECEKLEKTATGYRYTIKRLENEKHNLEDRLRTARSKSVVGPLSSDRSHLGEEIIENEKLRAEMRSLKEQLEMQKHRAGGLGAAMMQDKLEAQERKIAVLELSSKGSVEIRAELERLQIATSTLQKTNLRLEAENLELRLDLERVGGDAPHLRERVLYLEKYVEGLKEEIKKTGSQSKAPAGDCNATSLTAGDPKKNSELEKTVFLLKRVVEKLQVENKRLRMAAGTLGGSGGSATGRVCFADRSGQGVDHSLRSELQRIKEQYGESIQRSNKLQEDLKTAHSRIKMLENVAERPDEKIVALHSELVHVKTLLMQKSQLLDKVKVLLHKAAAREKSLHEQIANLKLLVPDLRAVPGISASSSSSDSKSDNLDLLPI